MIHGRPSSCGVDRGSPCGAAYTELGVHRLVLNLGSQRPEQDKRLPEIERLVKRAA